MVYYIQFRINVVFIQLIQVTFKWPFIVMKLRIKKI